jgi:hypothetical protein
MEKVNLTLEPINNLKAISQPLVKNLEKEFSIRFFIVTVPFPVLFEEELSCFTF